MEVDTAFFDGNHAEEVEVWRAFETGEGGDDRVVKEGYGGWRALVGRRGCGGNRRHAWMVDGEGGGKVTHVKLCMFPDGGIARFRVYGEAVPVWPVDKGMEVELSAAVMGGRVVGVSDEHFGKGGNLILPGRGRDMGDGWETKRSRGVGHVDWAVVKLGARGRVGRVVVDTLHFRGNFPRGVVVHGLDVGDGEEVVEGGDERWVEVVGESGCERDREHEFLVEKGESGERKVFTHMKMTIVPDGGVKRFRVFGTRV